MAEDLEVDPLLAGIEGRLRVGDFSRALTDIHEATTALKERDDAGTGRARLAAVASELNFYCGRNLEGQATIDSAHGLWTSEDDRLPARAQLQVAEYFYSKRNFSEAERRARTVRDACEQRDDRWGVGESSYYLARCSMRLHATTFAGHCDRAIESFAAAAGAGDRLPLELKWRIGLVHLVAGFAGWDAGQFDAARSRLFTAKWLLADTNDVIARANVEHTIASTFRSQAHGAADYTEALKALEWALGHYQSFQHNINVARVHTNIGRTYLDQGDFSNAQRSFDSARGAAKKIGDKATRRRQAAEVLLWVGWLSLQSSPPRVARAWTCGRRALKLSSAGDSRSARIQIEAQLVLGACQMLEGRAGDALSSFDAALRASETVGIPKLRINAHLSLAELFTTSTLRDSRQAQYHYARAQTLGAGTSRYLEKKLNNVASSIAESKDAHTITKRDLLDLGRVALEERFFQWAIQTLEDARLPVKKQALTMGLTPAGYQKMKRRLFPERRRARGRPRLTP